MALADRAVRRHFQPRIRRRRDFGCFGVEDQQHAGAATEEEMAAIDLAEEVEAEAVAVEGLGGG